MSPVDITQQSGNQGASLLITSQCPRWNICTLHPHNLAFPAYRVSDAQGALLLLGHSEELRSLKIWFPFHLLTLWQQELTQIIRKM